MPQPPHEASSCNSTAQRATRSRRKRTDSALCRPNRSPPANRRVHIRPGGQQGSHCTATTHPPQLPRPHKPGKRPMPRAGIRHHPLRAPALPKRTWSEEAETPRQNHRNQGPARNHKRTQSAPQTHLHSAQPGTALPHARSWKASARPPTTTAPPGGPTAASAPSNPTTSRPSADNTPSRPATLNIGPSGQGAVRLWPMPPGPLWVGTWGGPCSSGESYTPSWVGNLGRDLCCRAAARQPLTSKRQDDLGSLERGRQ